MDNNYIQVCAEIAYNDVLIEAYFNEEFLLEGDGSFLDKVKNFFGTIKNIIVNLFNKVIDFFKNCIDKIKGKSSKHENASLYNNLMEMVLTEGKNYESIATRMFLSNEAIISTCHSKLRYIGDTFDRMAKDPKVQNQEIHNKISDMFRDIETNYDEVNGIEDNCKKELDNINDNKSDSDKKMDISLLNYFNKNINQQNTNLKYEIYNVNAQNKYLEEKIRKEGENKSKAVELFKIQQYFYNLYLKGLSKVEKGYITLLKYIMKIAVNV